MSRLLARIMLALLMLPLATLVYVVTLVGYFETFGWRNEGAAFLFATGVAWAFIGLYWTHLWRATVRWSPRRTAMTAVSVPATIFAGVVVAIPFEAIEDEFGYFVGGVTAVLLWITASIFIWRETAAERRERVSRIGTAIVCPTCGYNLTGLRELTCPECGARWTVQELLAQQPGAEQID